MFSPDGTRIAYESTSTNLGPNDPSAAGDIYLYDIAGGTTSLVSADATGARSGNSVSVEPRFSADGTRIAFRSAASNLGPTDTNICPSAFISGPCHDVYVRDLSSGTTLLASVNASGTNAGDADSGARGWDFSADGTKVVFTSDATNLGPANAAGQIFLRDLEAGTTSLVTVASDGATSAGSSIQPVFSPDDRKVAFLSTAADLGPADTNGVLDLYERDLVFNASSLVSANEAGDDSGNGPVGSFAYRPDGTRIAYVTAASDHGEVDTNGVDDVYVAAPRPAG